LEQYDWPGNEWELDLIVQRAVILAAGNPIRPEHLPGIGPA
jgi:DNA-binding NtrC family response regulator